MGGQPLFRLAESGLATAGLLLAKPQDFSLQKRTMRGLAQKDKAPRGIQKSEVQYLCRNIKSTFRLPVIKLPDQKDTPGCFLILSENNKQHETVLDLRFFPNAFLNLKPSRHTFRY